MQLNRTNQQRKTATQRRRFSDLKNALRHSSAIAADRLLLGVLLGLICFFVLYPLVCIALRSFGAGEFTLQYYRQAWTQYGRSLWNSVTVGVAASVLCTVFSVAAALTVCSSHGFRRGLFLGILMITLVSPPFVGSLAYIQLYGRRGWITHGLFGLDWNPYNQWGIILMQSVSFVPMNAMFLNGILTKIDADSIRSARDLGASPAAILRDIVLPQIRPGIWVCLLLTFIRSLSDYGTPVIIGGRFSTIASDIYYQLTGYANLEKASAMNMFLLLPSIGAYFGYRCLMKRSDAMVNASRGRLSRLELPLHRCGWTGAVTAAASFVFYAMMVLQYLCIFSMGFIKFSKRGNHFTLEYLQRLLQTDLSTMIRSVEYALIVAVVGTLFAMVFSYYMERRTVPFRRGFDCLVTLPFMLPGTCFGIGYILAFNHPPLRLTGTALIVLANMLFKQLPSCTKICSATMQQIPKAQELAVRDLGGGNLAVLRDVILPGLRPAFFSCFAYMFSSSMTTAGAILFLINPARKLAVFKLFDAVYTGDYPLAALIATLMIVIVLAVEGLVFWLTGKAEKRNVSRIKASE